MSEEFEPIKNAIEEILNVSASVKRKNHTKKQHTKDLFINIITEMERLTNRSDLMYADHRLDFSTYDEPFLQVIDNLMVMCFGSEAYAAITFYLWERVNPDGSINIIPDADGNPIPLENPYDLWNLILVLNPKLAK